MPIQTDDIRTVLNAKGMIKFATRGQPFQPGSGGILLSERSIDLNYKMAVLTVSTAGAAITLTSVKESEPDANCVNIFFEDTKATLGAVTPPGYLYSGSFSGCVFYLYRDMFGALQGAHAARSSGKEASPVNYFTQRGCKLLWRYDTNGLAIANPGCFGSVLVCADQSTITGFAIATKGTATGLQVVSTLAEVTIDDWRRYEAA